MSDTQTDNGLPPTGTICWFEVPITDVARAAAFYKAVLGWECTQATDESGTSSTIDESVSVHMFTKGPLHGCFVKVARVTSIADPADHSVMTPLATFKVDDVNEALDLVTKNGGKVLMYVLFSLCLTRPDQPSRLARTIGEKRLEDKLT